MSREDPSDLIVGLEMGGSRRWREKFRSLLPETGTLTAGEYPEVKSSRKQSAGAEPRPAKVAAPGADYLKDFTAAASSSFTSKTVYNLVIWSRS